MPLRHELLALGELDCFQAIDSFHREVTQVASIQQGPRLTGPLHGGAWEGLRLRGDYFFAASAAAVFTSTSTSFLFNWGDARERVPHTCVDHVDASRLLFCFNLFPLWVQNDSSN